MCRQHVQKPGDSELPFLRSCDLNPPTKGTSMCKYDEKHLASDWDQVFGTGASRKSSYSDCGITELHSSVRHGAFLDSCLSLRDCLRSDSGLVAQYFNLCVAGFLLA